MTETTMLACREDGIIVLCEQFGNIEFQDDVLRLSDYKLCTLVFG